MPVRNSVGGVLDRGVISVQGLSVNRLSVVIVFVALALTVFEGAIRKWVIGVDTSELSYLAYFSKDIVFLSLLLLPERKSNTSSLKVFRRWLFPGCFLLIAGAIGSSALNVNPVGAVLTLRAAVLLPLIAYYALKRLNGISVRVVALLLALFTLGNFVLGVFQNQLPAENLINRYASSTSEIAVLATGVRASGTFAYIAGMAVISLVGIWAGLVLLTLGGNHRRQLLGWVSIASGYGCALTSVSRAPIILGSLMLVVWALFYRVGVSSGIRILVAGAFLWWLVIFFDLAPTFTELGQGLMLRQETAGDSFEGRAFGQLSEGIEAIEIAPFGNGFGTEQVGGNYYSQGTMAFTTFETQLPRIIMETGLFGLAGFLLICTGAVVTLQTAKGRAVTKVEKGILLATQLLLVSIFYTNVIFNHTASSFAWLIFVVALACRLDLPEPVSQQESCTTPRALKSTYANNL